MRRVGTIGTAAMALGLMVCATSAFAQRGAGAAGAPAADAAVRPPLLFKEEWKQPPYTGQLNDENRRVTQDAVTNPALEIKLYGAAAKEIGVYNHEGRFDLWNGMATSPVAVTLRDKANFIDLSGLARFRWMVRTNALHEIHPVVTLPDGTMLAGNRGVSTEGEYVQTEVVFAGMRWYKLDPTKIVTTVEVKNPDLTRVDAIGWVDLAPAGGHGSAGWHNVSTVELYAKPVPRAGSN